LNIQTERLENHTARFTVEVESSRLDNAKQVAARRLSKQVNIPGFRKGKAPYRVLVNYLGEGAILEDAIEVLGNEVYKESLDQSEVEPYGPGALENFEIEPTPKFTFIVPLQPTVDLANYRSVRLEYDPPKVEDEDVNRALRMLQEQHAVIEESQKPVAVGNRVTIDIHSFIVDAEQPESEEHEEFIHQHDMMVMLSDDPKREFAPGFNQALEGAAVGDSREFELTYPDDEEEYGEMAGQRVKFEVMVKKIETMTLPALNDDFAARVTEGEEQPLTLLELRIRVRENLQNAAESRYKSEYAMKALDSMVEQAIIGFPEALVEDQTERMVQQFDSNLRQQGLTLEDYLKISGKTRQEIAAEYREPAIRVIRRSLVLRSVSDAEQVNISEERINTQIETILSQFGERSDNFRPLFDQPAMRDSVRDDLLEQQVIERIIAIAKGEAPEPVSAAEPEASKEATEEGESS